MLQLRRVQQLEYIYFIEEKKTKVGWTKATRTLK